VQEELSRELYCVRLLAEARADTRQDARVILQTNDRPPQDEAMGETRGRASKGICYSCGDPSHFARNCPTKRRETRNRTQNSKRTEDNGAADSRDGRLVRMLTDDRLDRAAYLRMFVGGEWVDCLLDTGSEVCLCRRAKE
jgi:hypothetical protein